MKHPFKLSKTNIIYFIIVCLVFIVHHLFVSKFDAEIIGFVIGSTIGLFIFPFLIGLLFWYILGRKEKGGTTTFNIILTIVAISQFNLFIQKNNKEREIYSNIKSSIKDYKTEIVDEPDTSHNAYNKMYNSIDDNIDDLIKSTSSNDEKRVFLVLKKFLSSSDKFNTKWLNAHKEISKETFFDFSVLKDKDELENQIFSVNSYINASKEYKSFFRTRLTTLDTDIRNLEINNDFIKGVLKEIRKKDALQKPIFNPYIDSHIEYGEKIKEALYILKKNKWSYSKEGIINFKNINVEIEFNEILDEITEIEFKVNEWQAKLIETM